MKALSIQQPWAWLIVHGHKPVENRGWATQFRGEFLVHAGKKFDHAGYDLVRSMYPYIEMPAPADFPMGGIVGRATIIDCVTRMNSSWFYGRCGFVLADAHPMPLAPCKGMLGFFEVPDEMVIA
jgi:hypothetical protein